MSFDVTIPSSLTIATHFILATSLLSCMSAVNPKDVEVKKQQPFAFDVQFQGIELELCHVKERIMHSEVKGETSVM